MGTDICLPVGKYSHATGVRDNNTVPWSHLASTSLFIIVKGTDSAAVKDEKLMLRIVQGSDVLESLDVGTYIDKAVEARRSAQSTGMAIYMEQLPIFGITKDTVLAVRYTLSDGKARRLQMRMHTAAECRQLVHAFERRGMEFMEQRPGTARPGTGRPLTARPPTMSSHPAVPPTTSTQFSTAHQPARHPFANQVLEAGSLSQSLPVGANAFVSESHASLQDHTFDGQSTSLPKLFTRDESFAPREVSATRPSTAQFYRSHTMQPSQDVAHNSLSGGTTGLSLPSPNHGTLAMNNEIQRLDEPQSFVKPKENEYPSANSGTGFQLNNRSDAAVAATSAEQPPDSRPGTARPGTSSSFIFAETLEHEIPPRRELPFQRPDSHRSGSADSRPRSALALPSLPKPRTLPQKSSVSSSANMRPPSRSMSPVRPQTSSSLKRPHTDMYDSALGSGRPSTASPQKKISPMKVPSPQAPAKKPGRMDQLFDGRKVSLQKSSASKVQRVDSLADAPGEEDELYQSRDPSPTKVPTPRDSMSPVRRTDTARDPTINAYVAISSTENRGVSLQQYAEQSFEDRAAALDSFMVQNLENPDFVTLCKDVENCWKRIALGL